MSLDTYWWPEAEEDLLHVRSWRDAAWIDAEVMRYAEHGIGDVRRVRLRNGRQLYVLFLPGYRIPFSVDRKSRTMHVWRVLRSLPDAP